METLGDYEIKRQREASELAKREIALLALQAVNMPYLVEDED